MILMEHIEKSEQDQMIPSLGRRKFLRSLGALGAAALCGVTGEASAQDFSGGTIPSRYGENWDSSYEQMKVVYDREYDGEKILKNRFRRDGKRIIGSMNGKEIEVPAEFVGRVLGHLKRMLEAGALRFIFRLDAFHGHPYMDADLYEQRYGNELQDVVEETRILLADRDVEILYHNSEHLGHADNPAVRELVQKRNVIGRTVDASVEILPLPEGPGRVTARSAPEGTTNFRAYIKFAANKNGEFAISFKGKEIRLDLSLDDDEYF